MVEILNIKKGAIIIKINAAASNLNVRILMCHCGRVKNTEYIHLTD
jgi:hypothetical protein